MHAGSLVAYSLLEAAPEPITELSPRFIANCGSMTVEEPDVVLVLGNDQPVQHSWYEMTYR